MARRTLFESDRDIRKFLALLARSVRTHRLEIHAFAVLSTHFHLLVRSPAGELSRVLQWILNQYVRWFNRGRRRDGPLMRGRFVSKRADSLVYRRHLVRYIDFNPVDARLAAAPALYPFGSAFHFARPSGPPWLSRDWIEFVIAERTPGSSSRAARYAACFGDPLPPSLLRWIELRTAHPRDETDPLDDLLAAAPDQVLSWMLRKANLADGTAVGLPLCDPGSVEAAVREREVRDGPWSLELDRGTVSAWTVLRVGLLRTLCSSTLEQIAALEHLSTNGAFRTAGRHSAFLQTDPRYAATAGALASAALRHAHGAPPSSLSPS